MIKVQIYIYRQRCPLHIVKIKMIKRQHFTMRAKQPHLKICGVYVCGWMCAPRGKSGRINTYGNCRVSLGVGILGDFYFLPYLFLNYLYFHNWHASCL